jgi:oligosaccharide amylase
LAKPYLNDALIGNGRLLATLNSRGQLLRAFWPHVDYGQHIGSFTVHLADDESSQMESLHESESVIGSYLGDTNVVQFQYQHRNVKVHETSFAAPDFDVIVRHYRMGESQTQNSQEHSTCILGVRSDIPIYEIANYQSCRFEADKGVMVHYFRDVYVAIASDNRPLKYQCGGVAGDWAAVQLNGTDTHLSSESAMAFEFTNEITLYIAFGSTLSEALDNVERARTAGFEALLHQSFDAAKRYLANAKPWPKQTEDRLRHAGLTEAEVDVAREIYTRSILTFQLLQDDSGAMIAAPEFDEGFTRCGGYAYCWGRDAAYIVTAFECAGMTEAARRFYEWSIEVQEPNGVWEHRHHMDGRLAPAWGIQLDETASLVWGMAKHIKLHRDADFAQKALPAMEKAAEYLLEHTNEETGLPLASVDLWEERRGEHIYTAAAVAGALRELADVVSSFGTDDKEERAKRYRQAAEQMKAAVYENYSNQRQAFLRGRNLVIDAAKAERAVKDGRVVTSWQDEYGYTRYALVEDDVIDVSLLGLCVPFDVVESLDARMQSTARAIEHHLTREVGGIGRYENDAYIGGNPWILATLWLGIYQLRQGREQAALEQFRWAVNHRSKFGFLPEQVDRQSGETAWVVPLAWSHAMYVWFVHELASAGAPS